MGILIAHEVAHMWFGDTVTNAWWNNFWIKEGFAQYYGLYGLNVVTSLSYLLKKFH